MGIFGEIAGMDPIGIFKTGGAKKIEKVSVAEAEVDRLVLNGAIPFEMAETELFVACSP